MDRGDVGLELLLAGIGLGLALMTFVVTFDSTSLFQTAFAPTTTEAMHPLGYALDAAVLLSLAISVVGIACFSGAPPVARIGPAPRVTAEDRLDAWRRRKERRARKARASAGSQGST